MFPRFLHLILSSSSSSPLVVVPDSFSTLVPSRSTDPAMDESYFQPLRRREDDPMQEASNDSDTDMRASSSQTVRSAAMFTPSAPHARKPSRMSRSGAPRPIITPTSPLSSTIPHNTLPSAPASPPTPAPSPTPTQRVPDWSTAAEHEDSQIKNTRALFSDMNRPERLRLLGELLNLCDSHELSFVAEFVSPRLKKDPFMVLPTELSLRVSSTLITHCLTLITPCLGSRMRRRPHHPRPCFPGLQEMARPRVR